MPNDFHVKFMSFVLYPFFDDLNNTSNFLTKISPATKFEAMYQVTLVDGILKNT